ncbi:arginase [Brevipalpus obovatus]|uniref:arginase n=1 Tax=Brevipalpus obovatus TaxID=246614 RepID=UPI003D9FA1FA
MLQSRSVLQTISRSLTNKVGLIGACFDKGQHRDGTQYGPRSFRDAGLISFLNTFNFDVKDYGDLWTQQDQNESNKSSTIGSCKNSRIVNEANVKLKNCVIKCLQDERICITLGGDHSLGLGTVAGNHHVNPNVSVLWIDAHADINTESTSPSGNMHGMPLSFLVHGIGPQHGNSSELIDLFREFKPFLDHKSLSFIGLRDIDPYEKVFLDKLDIKYFTMNDIDRLGIQETVYRALDAINPTNDRPLHIGLDVDGLDPIHTPSTGTPVPGGLTLDEAQIIGDIISRTGLMRCLDVAELNPKIGSPEDVRRTIESSFLLIQSFLGKRQLNSDSMKSENDREGIKLSQTIPSSSIH